MSEHNQKSARPLHRVVGRVLKWLWTDSLAESMWRDFTPIGRVTIFPPLVLVGYSLLPVLLIFCAVLVAADKCGAVSFWELVYERTRRVFLN